ncbi:MAG: hypothetical protein AB8H86_01425 [Polyangiales bacterium]
MKRAVQSVLALAGLVLLGFALRYTLDDGAPRSEEAIGDPVDSEVEDEVRPPAASRQTPPRENGEPLHVAAETVENEMLVEPSGATQTNGEGLEAAGDELPAPESNEVRPLRRYQDDDALAIRRARQIELVSEARRQARVSLEAAEERGDTESAAQTRGVLRRLELRLTALEAAASSAEPY